jgi:hypothetical protein
VVKAWSHLVVLLRGLCDDFITEQVRRCCIPGDSVVGAGGGKHLEGISSP